MEHTKVINMSVLDRLLDDGLTPATDQELSTKGHALPITHAQSLRRLHSAVRRDLEALLNTRRRAQPSPEALKELEYSLVDYGIPDFTELDVSSAESRLRFTRMIRQVILKYDPRFKSVQVTMLENVEPLDHTLRFRIDAIIHAQPAAESVMFDSAVEPVTGTVHISDSNRG